jgi:hypothetical protein
MYKKRPLRCTYKLYTERRWRTTQLLICGCLTVLGYSLTGCLLSFGDCGISLTVSGRLLDSDTSQPIQGAALGGRTITDGMTTDGGLPSFTPDGEPRIASGVDGAFMMLFVEALGPCGPRLREFTRPDQVEIIVLRDGCEQRSMIEVNEDTVVDLSFPNRTLELKDPILVPPCEE